MLSSLPPYFDCFCSICCPSFVINLTVNVVCIEFPIVFCHCYLGVFVIDCTVFWFVLLSIVLVIVFSEVISTVECLCSWGIWGELCF